MFKVAFLHEQEIAREQATQPKINDKFNIEELSEFYGRIGRQIKQNYNNSKEVQFYWVIPKL